MRKYLLLSLTLFLCINALAQDTLKVMSYNIRFGSATETMAAFEWDQRKYATPALIADVNPDVFGSQEVEEFQHKYILLNCRDYAGYWIAREPNEKHSSATPLYWNKKRVKPMKIGVFWMSLTPDIPSKDWGAAHFNQASWGIFKIKSTGREFFFMNIHLDSKSVEARREGLKLAEAKCKELNPKNLPVILLGDFNMNYKTKEVTGFDKVMNNARLTCQKGEKDVVTFHKFGRFDWSNHIEILDHVYWQGFNACREYEVVQTSYEGIPFVSDHYPVKVLMEF